MGKWEKFSHNFVVISFKVYSNCLWWLSKTSILNCRCLHIKQLEHLPDCRVNIWLGQHNGSGHKQTIYISQRLYKWHESWDPLGKWILKNVHLCLQLDVLYSSFIGALAEDQHIDQSWCWLHWTKIFLRDFLFLHLILLFWFCSWGY